MSAPVPAFVIQAHPLRDSYNAALHAAVVRGLEAAGHEVTSAHLDEGDDPEVGDLAGRSCLTFVYPTWWGGPPAVLLDWLQRRLGPHLEGDRRGAPLGDVRLLAAVTSHGSARWVNLVQGEPGRQFLIRGLRRLCAPDVVTRWVALYKLDRLPRTELETFVARVEDELTAAGRAVGGLREP